MLTKTPACVEGGLVWGAPPFRHEDHAPLYWSDQGILYSTGSATKHFDQRREDGTFDAGPSASARLTCRPDYMQPVDGRAGGHQTDGNQQTAPRRRLGAAPAGPCLAKHHRSAMPIISAIAIHSRE